MKLATVLIAVVLLLLCIPAFAGDVWVNGHYRDSNGDGIKETYVNGHYRTSPDSRIDNNYSTYPNINPYTGSQGTKYKNSYGIGAQQQLNNSFGSGGAQQQLNNSLYGN